MNASGTAPPNREHRLDEVLGAYLEAAALGQAPPPEALTAAHPDLADELTAFFEGDSTLARWTAPLRPAARAALGEAVSAARAFGDFELLEEIGRGGMGLVCKARQRSLNRTVALKRFRSDRAASPGDAQRFRDEANIVALLDHPNIVPIYDVGEHGRELYLCLKWMEGGSLADHLPRFRQDVRSAARLVAVAARAVHHAHQRGVLHRDLKPSNILLDARGQPHVADFGLARRLGLESELTYSGQMIGTPSYMAPEQTLGRPHAITTAADVYGLGAVLHALLTGDPPFRGATPAETMALVREREPSPPSRRNTAVDADLDTICLKCLEKEPARRYASAEALADDLECWLSGRQIQARPVGPVGRAWRWCRRNPLVAGLAAACVFLLNAGLAGLGGGVMLLAAKEADARRQQHHAEQQQALAEQRERDIRLQLYPASINQAYRAWQAGDFARAGSLLDSSLPAPGQEDLRGCEWRMLRRLVDHCPRVRAVLRGHEGEAYMVRYSPDGTTLATAGKDRTVRLWDAATGGLTRTLKGHDNEVNAVAFAPDGRTLATASDDRTVRTWVVGTGRELATLGPFEASVVGVVIAPDGRMTVAGLADGGLVAWTPDSREGRRFPSAHTARVQSMAFSPDGRYLATVSDDRLLVCWKAPFPSEERLFTGQHSDAVTAVGFSPSGRWIATACNDRSIRIWDVGERAGSRRLAIDSNGQSVMFSADEKYLAVACDDDCVRLWDWQTQPVRTTLRDQGGRAWCATYSPDGKTLAVVGGDGALRLWDVGILNAAQPLPGHARTVHAVAASPADAVVATASLDGVVRLWDAEKGRLLDSFSSGEGAEPYSVTFDRRGVSLAAGFGDGTVRVWDVRRKASPITSRADHRERIDGLAFSPDGQRLWTTSSPRAWAVGHFDAATGQAQPVPPPPMAPYLFVATLPSGPLLIGLRERTVRLWEPLTGREATLPGAPSTMQCVAASADGAWVAGGEEDGTVRLWRVESGTGPVVLHGHTQRVMAVTFSPDGRTLASGGYDGTVRLWHTATGQELMTLSVARGHVHSLAWLPGGDGLISAGRDQDARGQVLNWFWTPGRQ